MIGFCYNCEKKIEIPEVAVQIDSDTFICTDCHREHGDSLTQKVIAKVNATEASG
jgi:protein-arginine kinase activator protein McsA